MKGQLSLIEPEFVRDSGAVPRRICGIAAGLDNPWFYFGQ